MIQQQSRRAEASMGPMCTYIRDIPVQNNPLFAFSAPSETYMEALKSYLGIAPDKPKISFKDDIWDFGNYFTAPNKAHLRLKFYNIPTEVRDNAKFYSIFRMISGVQIETIEGELARLSSFFVRFTRIYPDKNAGLLSNGDIQAVIDEWKGSNSHYKTLYSVFHLYSFISINDNVPTCINFKKLNKAVMDAKAKERTSVNYRKTPNIPEEYVSIIERAALNVLRDETADFDMRVIGGYLLTDMWTGLRSSELSALKTDSLYTEKVNHGADEAYFIYYSCSKKSRTNNHEFYQSSFCPELAVEAIKTISELKKTNRYTKQNSYLFNLLDVHGHLLETPLSPSSISCYIDAFFTRYLSEACRKEWEGVSPHRARVWDSSRKTKSDAKIYVPTCTQYRVHLCSYFYSHGVDLPFIEINMGHMSCDMGAYYYRKEDETHKKELRTATTFLKNILANNYEPLGVNGSAIKKDIKSILSRTKYDVYKDIEEMASVIGQRYIIRAKLVGVCVKLAPTTCATDDVSDKMLCAYGYCKNILHFFYMLDMSYAGFQALIQSYEANVKGNHINAAQHELKRIQDQIRIRLDPEIKQLEEELERKGVGFILKEHPQLESIISNLDNIKEEIQIWKKRKN